jgi:hypothetical protein
MAPSDFLTELAIKLERGSLPEAELQPLALACRDYATLALDLEQPKPPKVVYLQAKPRPRKQKKVVGESLSLSPSDLPADLL